MVQDKSYVLPVVVVHKKDKYVVGLVQNVEEKGQFLAQIVTNVG